MNLKNCETNVEIQIRNPKSENSDPQIPDYASQSSKAPSGFGVRQALGAFDWLAPFPKAPEDRRTPGRKRFPGLPENLLRLAALGLALLCLAAGKLHACGLSFPNNLLGQGDNAVLLAPVAHFRAELERLHLVSSRFEHVEATNSYEQQTIDAELADLTVALKKAKVSPTEASRIVEAHRVNRQRLSEYLDAYAAWDSGSWRDTDEAAVRKHGAAPAFPSFAEVPGLPGDFADYFAGAVALRKPGIGNVFREAWERLLARPAAERKYKSTWAAFMLGKTLEQSDDDKAVEYFRMTRDLARHGFADSIGLAVAAIGLEARVELRRSHFKQAIELYLEQFAAGDDSAVASLRTVATTALGDPEALSVLASDSHAQKVITAYILSVHAMSRSNQDNPTAQGNEIITDWLSAVEKAGITDLDSAEMLALAAYQAGAFATAQRWINRAKNSAVAQWLQAKLWLRAGKIQQAATLYAKVAARLPVISSGDDSHPGQFADSLFMRDDEYALGGVAARNQVLGELGVLQLSRREFTQALDALLNAGSWIDAAYVAERVLTTDELKDYVDRFWPLTHEAPKSLSTDETHPVPTSVAEIRESIRYLLARRLTRELRGDVARMYYPAEWQPRFDELATTLQAGWNENLPPDQRAKSLFSAAFIARTNGMELLGTELQPDWHFCGGNSEGGLTWERRATNALAAKINLASTNEIQRALKHSTDPERRFHYRYQAALLAWEAAKLMPNHSGDTAFVLWTAGSWLKGRDPLTADIFYKALVRRCRKTALGAEADRRRWFPDLDDEGQIIPRKRTELASSTQPSESSPQMLEPDAELTEVAEPELPVENGNEFIIEPGDTLAAIVRALNQHGIQISVEDILEANPGLDPTRLVVGQKVFIPITPLPAVEAPEAPQ